MFKKTRVRQIIELLQKNLSDREISNALGVSRNSVARIRQSSDDCSREWDELLMMTDDELYIYDSNSMAAMVVMPFVIILYIVFTGGSQA